MVAGVVLPVLCAAAADVKVTRVDENPKITLKLKDVTAAEAMAALTRASGHYVSMFEWPEGVPPPVKPPGAPSLDQRGSFDWSDVTFSQAMRQLMQRYGLV